MKHDEQVGMPEDPGAGMPGGMGGAARMKAMLESMPAGVKSPSGHYWCAMCKKMFEMEDAVCPYMPSMCVNTPIAIETLPPGSTAFYERIGLFYLCPGHGRFRYSWDDDRLEPVK